MNTVPQSGTYVFSPTAEDVRGLSHLRAVLENEALHEAMKHRPAHLLQRLDTAVATMKQAIAARDWPAYGSADNDYHRAIIEESGKPVSGQRLLPGRGCAGSIARAPARPAGCASARSASISRWRSCCGAGRSKRPRGCCGSTFWSSTIPWTSCRCSRMPHRRTRRPPHPVAVRIERCQDAETAPSGAARPAGDRTGSSKGRRRRFRIRRNHAYRMLTNTGQTAPDSMGAVRWADNNDLVMPAGPV